MDVRRRGTVSARPRGAREVVFFFFVVWVVGCVVGGGGWSVGGGLCGFGVFGVCFVLVFLVF